MTMPRQTLNILILGLPWIMVVTGLIIHSRLAWTKNLELMISALPSSYWLKLSMTIWRGNGLKSRFHLESTIAAIVFWPVKEIHIRNGKLDREDIVNFPKNLKIQLLIGNLLTLSGALLLGFAYYMVKR